MASQIVSTVACCWSSLMAIMCLTRTDRLLWEAKTCPEVENVKIISFSITVVLIVVIVIICTCSCA